MADGLLQLIEWAQESGGTGVLIYFLAYVVATVSMVPGLILTMGAGFLYGPVWGTALVSPASVTGASLAFLLGRSFLRRRIAKKVESKPRFSAIDRAVGEEGFKVVLLLRLSPIFPFNFLNYALGLTRVSFWKYASASFLGMLPGTFLYVYFGSVVTNASELLSGQRSTGIGSQLLFWGGLAATLLVTVLITRTARRALRLTIDVPAEVKS